MLQKYTPQTSCIECHQHVAFSLQSKLNQAKPSWFQWLKPNSDASFIKLSLNDRDLPFEKRLPVLHICNTIGGEKSLHTTSSELIVGKSSGISFNSSNPNAFFTKGWFCNLPMQASSKRLCPANNRWQSILISNSCIVRIGWLARLVRMTASTKRRVLAYPARIDPTKGSWKSFSLVKRPNHQWPAVWVQPCCSTVLL